jgi:DNA-binding CsgD family transcriptional regulator
MAMGVVGKVAADHEPPRDIHTARTMLDDAATAMISAIERGEDDAVSAAQLLLELRRLADLVGEASIAYRLQATGHVYSAIARLRTVKTAAELLDAAPLELARCGFDRIVLTRISGAIAEVVACYDAFEPERARELLRLFRQQPSPLSPFKLEGEMLRRRSPMLVERVDTESPDLHPALALTQCRSYVAAPIVPQGKVIGVLHADCHHQRRYVDEFDRDRLWMFAEGFGHVYERRALLDRIRSLRHEVRRANSSIVAVMGDYVAAPIELAPEASHDATMADSAASMFIPLQARASSLLTKREREVMTLVAAGHTNPQIAAELVLSEQTVRSHMKRILRKLRAVNRAEAVARWTSRGPV